MAERGLIAKKIDRDTRITLFQKKVYKAVSNIPRGEIRTYRWVAEKAGYPLAFRAVGSALKKNPYAPEVPCHRVIRSDNSIGGYAGGVRKKKMILRKEGVYFDRGSGQENCRMISK